MNKTVVFLSTFFIVFINVTSALSEQYWAKTYGGNGDDVANSIQQTQDGGSIVAGYTSSFGTDSDAWVIKLDSTGDITWEKRYGSSNDDEAHIIQQTTDGGYIVLGCYYCESTSDENTWLFKLASNGDITWQRTYPRPLFAIEQTSDGGYIFTGGGGYIGVLKLDSAGTITWQKTYQEDYPRYEVPYTIKQTEEGGYIVGGVSTLVGCGGCGEMQILKLDSNGDITWQRRYPGFSTDANDILQTGDGGYILAGKRGPYYINQDFFVAKLDTVGNIIWQKGYDGGSVDDIAYAIEQTSDGNYIVSGYYYSEALNSHRIWFVKIDSNGNILGQKRCEDCNVFSLQQTDGGGFITAGVKPDDAGMLDLAVFNFDSNWEIPNCPVMEETTAFPYETSDYSELPELITQSISSVLTDTTVTPQDTSAETSDVCCYDTEDNDNDCVSLEEDNCPYHYNPLQEDTYPPQGNRCGDACDCEGNFDDDEDQDGSDAATFKSDFGRSIFVDPCINSDPCNGDFDCDFDVDGTDAAQFKEDFGRSPFSNPCPICPTDAWCIYEGDPFIKDYSDTGCLGGSSQSSSDQDGICANEDRVTAEVMGNSIIVASSIYGNCCSGIEVELTVDGNDLHLFMMENPSGTCFCNCCFGVETEVAGLAAGEYTIEMCWYDWGSGYSCETETVVVP